MIGDTVESFLNKADVFTVLVQTTDPMTIIIKNDTTGELFNGLVKGTNIVNEDTLAVGMDLL